MSPDGQGIPLVSGGALLELPIHGADLYDDGPARYRRA